MTEEIMTEAEEQREEKFCKILKKLKFAFIPITIIMITEIIINIIFGIQYKAQEITYEQYLKIAIILLIIGLFPLAVLFILIRIINYRYNHYFQNNLAGN